MKRLLFFAVLLPFIIISCTQSTEVADDSISVSVQGDHVVIQNNERETIYLFLVEQNTAALINWAPHTGDPNVKGKQAASIKFNDIDEADGHVEDGDIVVVYFWKKSAEWQEIKSKTVKL